ncbi:ABC-2 type transporter [Desulfarculus baarsii DSM 2075]|uniref:ABC-2 type transporter n=1 Tax=Desulfarculus baarsii (strain ATCC 33931 / DSM 2075 / LMG 7858 / VKM B-1802 / 2st14) TaxID=644282 RepID=E1QEB5_DESB2|nr:ABC transporter permease [Desulfarculus baarsii]ADK83901.1 ABC-2 type transporter [Desulfarculus baarsii DSM 2075]
MSRFSPRRLGAIIAKEFVQMRRDRLTFAMMVMIPIMQLVLFGYAINSDPKHLPTAVIVADHGPFGRTLLAALQQSDYFDFVAQYDSQEQGRQALALGQVQFVVNIPVDFSRKLMRGQRPRLLLEADATDPSAVGNALGVLGTLAASALDRDLKGPLARLRQNAGPVEVAVHRLYNPEAETQYNIVPGLMGVVLSMTLVIITGLAMTRERERGTMENLLTTPVRPLEVILGKIIPYILVGYVQMILIMVAAKLLFDVPFLGSISFLLCASLIFIAANLAVGITFSTVAQNQLQAVEMAFFFFLPSVLLSGFMFPFRGMPQWAQYVGEILPLTHYLRLVRGLLLKGNSPMQAMEHIWPLALFVTVMVFVSVKRYRQTLD